MEKYVLRDFVTGGRLMISAITIKIAMSKSSMCLVRLLCIVTRRTLITWISGKFTSSNNYDVVTSIALT